MSWRFCFRCFSFSDQKLQTAMKPTAKNKPKLYYQVQFINFPTLPDMMDCAIQKAFSFTFSYHFFKKKKKSTMRHTA